MRSLEVTRGQGRSHDVRWHRHQMLLALSVNIMIFSVPNIEGPPNIICTLYL